METVRFEIWRKSGLANVNTLALVLILEGELPPAEETHILLAEMHVPRQRATAIRGDGSKRALFIAVFQHIVLVNSSGYQTGDQDIDALLSLIRQAVSSPSHKPTTVQI